MKNFLNLLLSAGLMVLFIYPTYAQDYPLWLADPGRDYNEYPTSIASNQKVTATVGVYESSYEMFDIVYNPYHFVPCTGSGCGYDNVFVTWRDESNGGTWSARILFDGMLNNHVGAQSAPQVELNDNNEVYVSFTYSDYAIVKDVSGNFINIFTAGVGGNRYDLAVVKFDANGDYLWHLTEGNQSNDYVTDLDYDDNTKLLAIAGYVEGNDPLILSGAATIKAVTQPSSLGPNYPFGHAFAAVYEDNGSSANYVWSTETGAYSYSTDIVIDENGYTFMSGYYYKTSTIAGQPFSSNYTDGNFNYNYFLVGMEPGGNAYWAESYGTQYNELNISADKHLRNTSLARIPQSIKLIYALNSTGNSGGFFSEFGTYVNLIDGGNGGVASSLTVGNSGGANGTTYPGSTDGSPTYNPNITVNAKAIAYISGNFLLTNQGSTDLGIAFEEMEIGGTYVNHGMTNAANAGQNEAVGWYTAVIDFSGVNLSNENLNYSYVPNNPTTVYNQLPVYGTSQNTLYDRFYYTALGFKNGELELDLSVNHGFINNYNNSGGQQYDGLVVRSFTGNGQYAKPNSTAGTQGTVRNTTSNLVNNSNVWKLSPNPVSANQTVLWSSESSNEGIDQIRLMDMTGRVLQVWKQPKATAQGFQLPLGDLVPGFYLLEASGEQVQQSSTVVVK